MRGNDKSVRTTLIIVGFVILTFLCYLTIGIPLAVVPGFVHEQLGFGSMLAGLAISSQYVATLLSRSSAGRMADVDGPRKTVLRGMAACFLSGILMLAAAYTSSYPLLSLAFLIMGRLAVGFGESCIGTGAILWAVATVGPESTAKVISWNGIATFGALAIGAPVGVVMFDSFGFGVIGATILFIAVLGASIAWRKQATAIVAGIRLPFRRVLLRVLPHGLGLALGSIGFGTIATFITLYFASKSWPHAAMALSAFGLFFILSRLFFADSIARFGGFKVAMASFVVEGLGLLVLWHANGPIAAQLGAALTGGGFALVFPALGVEAVGQIAPASRGTALGVYSVFLDLALGISGPLVGFLIARAGYETAFLAAAMASAAGLVLTMVLATHTRAAAGRAEKV
ncbi:Predicted arabinose efflux permease, MFS family [Arboricoccus pini]|uniref:Uncharacterized MFS-type transporter SAMN07250955_106180 n=1 Tax=Arboricoccus pini TaxID=1963835 RepID=A0A212R8G8_9PROT|nr:MFS transporter [Arboricoccus pini]SNB68378.1 Predicted arabinose efflux permease, MFS family [Arboricoccus pini]